jgi:DNA-binding LytR/AlgR family response regulator
MKQMKNENLVHIGSRKNVIVSKIIMLKADANYTNIYLCDGNVFLTSTTLGILEHRLKEYNFYRTHRSTLINMVHFSDIDAIDNLIYMGHKKNINIPIARRKMNDFLRVLQNR